LRQLARSTAHPRARLHALWTLEGLDAVDWPTTQAALNDIDVDVAVAGARLAERFFAGDAASVARAFAARMRAGEPTFLRQAALSLGAGPSANVDELLAKLAIDHGSLPFMADALVSSWSGREPAALSGLATAGPGTRAVVASLAAAILRSQSAQEIDTLFARLQASPAWMVDAILDGVERFIPGEGPRRRTAFLPREPAAFTAFAKSNGAQATRAAESLKFLRWRGQQIDESRVLAALSETERKRFEQGREEFKLCAACHQPQGQGMAGLAPPLVGSPWVNGSSAATIRIVLQGKTNGETTMPPLAALEDDKIAAILTYVRHAWGNEASAVTAGEVQAVRSETKLREEPWNETELGAYN
jgi:mono/diheme cytochrome c family protein